MTDLTDPRPPQWAEYVLRVLLRARDRETITGDLLEEYREVALPTLGPLRAKLWYLRQVGSLMNTANASIPSSIWIGIAGVSLSTLCFLLVRSNFGPPMRLRLAILVAVALGITAATAIRTAADFKFLWRASRSWGLLFAGTLLVGNVISALASHLPVFLREQAEASHPGHVPEVSPLLMRLFVIAIAAIYMAAGFRGAWRTGQVRKGICAALGTSVIGSLLAFAVGILIENLFFGEMSRALIPFAVILVSPMLSTVPGSIGGMFGRGLGGSLQPRPS